MTQRDAGITGTSTKKRTAFHRMINEAQEGRFNLILTKEISRFARNTLDSIYYTRKLKEYGVGVLFLNDGINTLDADAELRLTILASIAQEESRKTSERVKWGQQRRMEQGVVFGRDLLGYDVHGGTLTVNEEGAAIVRLIFHKFVVEGKGAHLIAKELQEEHIPPAPHMKQWSHTAILRILRNEKMAGDLIQKKTYTPNYLTHEKKCNHGEEDFIMIRDHHQPIVSRELFLQAQEQLSRRASLAPMQRHSSRHCFSGKIKCEACVKSFVSRSKIRKDGSLYQTWKCAGTLTPAPLPSDRCPCPTISNENLRQLLMEIMASLSFDRNALIELLCHSREETLHGEDSGKTACQLQEKLHTLEAKRQRLIELYLSELITREEFLLLKTKQEAQLFSLQSEWKEASQNRAAKPPKPSAERPDTFLGDLLAGNLWNDSFYRHLLQGITVSPTDTLTITLTDMPLPWIGVRENKICRSPRHS